MRALVIALAVLVAGCGLARVEPCDHPSDHICDEDYKPAHWYKFPWLS